jgi:hypothetical protein
LADKGTKKNRYVQEKWEYYAFFEEKQENIWSIKKKAVPLRAFSHENY